MTVQCDCGTVTKTYLGRLTTGKAASCGCVGRRKYAERTIARNTVHGLSKTRTYKVWKGMLSRCRIASASGYAYYGGRGVSVCDRWAASFENFLADMGEAPPGLTIDRIDTNGDYEPGNCRWATHEEQCNNRRRNVRVEVDGILDTLARTAARKGFPRHRIYYYKQRYGFTTQQAVDAVVAGLAGPSK